MFGGQTDRMPAEFTAIPAGVYLSIYVSRNYSSAPQLAQSNQGGCISECKKGEKGKEYWR